MTSNARKEHSRTRPPSPSDVMRGLFGAFFGIGSVAVVAQFVLGDADLLLVIGAFGATAVLVYGAPYSPLAQPYNVLVGHLVSATVGVTAFQWVGETSWLSAALAVSVAIALMQITRSVHPPGGATALIAVVASPAIHDLGYLYVVYPVGGGAIILVGVALISNNIRNPRRWPVFWV